MVIFFFPASAQKMVETEEISEQLVSDEKLSGTKEILTNYDNTAQQDLVKILSNTEINNASLKRTGNEASGPVTIFVTGCYSLNKFCKPPFDDCDYYWVDVCLEN